MTIKKVYFVIRKLVFSFLMLYGLNVMLKYVNVIIPINIINIIITYFLGGFGVLALVIIKLLII